MKNFLKNKSIQKILLLGILIRLLIMPFYFHPDIKVYNFQSSFFKQGVFNIYTYLGEQKSKLPLKEEFVYFPLTYFVLGGYQFLAQPFLTDEFDIWLSNASASHIDQPGVYRYLFVLKFPYLIMDLLIGLLLVRFFTDFNLKKKVISLWMFNPFSILLIYVFSNVDIYPVLLTVISLLLLFANKFILSAFLLGIASGFKAYPLLFLPLVLLYTVNFRQKVLAFVTGVGVFLATILPFIQDKQFHQAALVSGLTTRLLQTNIDIGFGEKIILPVVLLSVFYFYFYLKSEKTKFSLIMGFFSLPLIIFAFIHYHVQWILWIVPFGVLIAAVQKQYLFPLFFLGIFLILVPLFYNDKFMNFGLLSPISSSYQLLPSFYAMVSKVYDPLVFLSIVHSLLTGFIFVLIIKLLITKQDEN